MNTVAIVTRSASYERPIASHTRVSSEATQGAGIVSPPIVKEEPKNSFLKSTFKQLVDYARKSPAASGVLKFVATSFYLTNELGLYFGVNLGFKKLIEGELNRKLFQPEIIVKIPKEPLKMVTIKTPNEPNLSSYYFEKPNSKLAVIYLHGYNGSIFEGHPECKKIKEDINATVLITDYRGFGISEGTPTIDGVVRDVERMYDYLTTEKGFQGENIIIYGSSLGGAIALETYVTKLKPEGKKLGAIALLFPFSSIRDITKWRYPETPYNVIPNDKLNSQKLAKHIDIPLHMAHGDADDETPCIQSFSIYKGAKLLSPDQKEIYVIKGVGHKVSIEPSEITPYIQGYFQSLKDFTTKHFPEHTF